MHAFAAEYMFLQVAFHFATDSVSIFDLKGHLTKKGFDVEQASSAKQRRSSGKSKSDTKYLPYTCLTA